MQLKYISSSPAHSHGLLRKAGAAVVTVVLAGLALMFSAALLALILIGGAMAWAYLWWKTRKLRGQMKNFPQRDATDQPEIFEGEVIEGEATLVDIKRDVS